MASAAASGSDARPAPIIARNIAVGACGRFRSCETLCCERLLRYRAVILQRDAAPAISNPTAHDSFLVPVKPLIRTEHSCSRLAARTVLKTTTVGWLHP